MRPRRSAPLVCALLALAPLLAAETPPGPPPAVAGEDFEKLRDSADPADRKRLFDAAESGNPAAQVEAAMLLLKPEPGRPYPSRNQYEAALPWFAKAAAQGFPGGRTALANAYETGQGVARDPDQALAWHMAAALDAKMKRSGPAPETDAPTRAVSYVVSLLARDRRLKDDALMRYWNNRLRELNSGWAGLRSIPDGPADDEAVALEKSRKIAAAARLPGPPVSVAGNTPSAAKTPPAAPAKGLPQDDYSLLGLAGDGDAAARKELLRRYTQRIGDARLAKNDAAQKAAREGQTRWGTLVAATFDPAGLLWLGGYAEEKNDAVTARAAYRELAKRGDASNAAPARAGLARCEARAKAQETRVTSYLDAIATGDPAKMIAAAKTEFTAYRKFALLETAAGKDHAGAKLLFADACASADALARDDERAFRFAKAAADAGDPEAKRRLDAFRFRLAKLYYTGGYAGYRSVAKQPEKTFALCREISESGRDAKTGFTGPARLLLSLAYAQGLGGLPTDGEKAEEWRGAAAAAGYARKAGVTVESLLVSVDENTPAPAASVAVSPKVRVYETVVISTDFLKNLPGYWELTCKGRLVTNAMEVHFSGNSGAILMTINPFTSGSESFNARVETTPQQRNTQRISLTIDYQKYRFRGGYRNPQGAAGDIVDAKGTAVGTWEIRRRPDLDYYALALKARSAKDAEAAIHYYGEANKLRARTICHVKRAGLLYDLRRDAESEAELTAALRLDPADAIVLRNRIIVRYASDNYTGMLEDADRFIGLHPGDPDAALIHFYRGNALWWLKRKEEADKAYDTAIAMNPGLKNRTRVANTREGLAEVMRRSTERLASDLGRLGAVDKPAGGTLAKDNNADAKRTIDKAFADIANTYGGGDVKGRIGADKPAGGTLATTQKPKTAARADELLAAGKKDVANRAKLLAMADSGDPDAQIALGVLMTSDPAPDRLEIYTRFAAARKAGATPPKDTESAVYRRLTIGEYLVSQKADLAASRAYAAKAKALFEKLCLPDESMDALAKRADAGDRDANLALACRHSRGVLGAKADEAETEVRRRVAAARIENEDTEIGGLFRTADLEDDGRKAVKARVAAILDPLPVRGGALKTLDLRKKSEEAVKRLADTGDADAQYDYASRYAEVFGFDLTEEERARCLDYLRKAADQGHAGAMYRLYEILIDGVKGEGQTPAVAKNEPEAMAWLQKAADKDYTKALDTLGIYYDNGEHGLPKDEKRSLELFTRSSRLGDRDGQYSLAFNHLRQARRYRKQPTAGKEAEAAKAADALERLAVRQYELAAGQGHAMAHVRLGEAYHDGLYGKPKDAKASYKHYEAAYKLGSTNAYWFFANANRAGDPVLGIAKSPKNAVPILEMLAGRRDRIACSVLVEYYEGKDGFPPDPEKAYVHRRLHVEYGGMWLDDKIAELQKSLGPEKIKKLESGIGMRKALSRPGPVEY